MRTCPSCKKAAPDEAGFCPACSAQFPVAKPRSGMSPKTAAILVVAICIPLLVICLGIISAIAIPNFVDSTQRARQKRAIADIRTMGTALLDYETDMGSPPQPGGGEGWVEVPVDRVEIDLCPTYLKSIPLKDPWGNPYLYGYNAEEKSFYVLSLGKNGSREIEALPEQIRTTTCYESDILWLYSEFVQYPEGNQRSCGRDMATYGASDDGE